MKNQELILSKIATNNGHGENSAFFDGWKAYDSDPYHPTQNPNGVIQMGLAENQVELFVTKSNYFLIIFMIFFFFLGFT